MAYEKKSTQVRPLKQDHSFSVSVAVLELLPSCPCANGIGFKLKTSSWWEGKMYSSYMQVPDTGAQVLDNTRPILLCSSTVSFWIALSKECKHHIFGQY